MAAEATIDFHITWVRTLDEARNRLATAARPDCIVLDLNLPDSRGLDALGIIERHASDVPVIVMTGLAEEQAGLTAVAEGAQDYLVKGVVDTALLTRSVRYAIERQNAARTAAALQVSEQRSQENARLERGLLPVPPVANRETEGGDPLPAGPGRRSARRRLLRRRRTRRRHRARADRRCLRARRRRGRTRRCPAHILAHTGSQRCRCTSSDEDPGTGPDRRTTPDPTSSPP